MGELTHTQIEELLGAFALDAVDAEEAQAVAAHLPYCPRCRAEVGAHQEVAASLAQGGAPAPEDLWPRIAANLEEPPPRLDMARLVPLRPRGRGTRVVAAAAAAAVIAGLGVVAVRQEERIDDLSAVVDRRALDNAASAALSDRGSRRVELRSDDGQVFVQTVLQQDGTGFVVDHNLPPLPADRTYQLWARVGDGLVSVGLLGPQPAVAAFKVDRDPTVLAVTAEPAGGVSAPTQPPLATALFPDARRPAP